jgi:hypothetical protein
MTDEAMSPLIASAHDRRQGDLEVFKNRLFLCGSRVVVTLIT